MLYIVATPIGNLKEITIRAIEVLKSVDIIYAEDTRHSAVLLNEYQINKPLFSYEKFSEKEKCAEIINFLQEGKDVALISDAGMPLISDPGSILVKELIEKNLEYTVISGACACINALILSGMDTSSFFMAGFLPSKSKKKQEFLKSLSFVPATLIFYCPPHDIDDYLCALYEAFGQRKVSVVREISKKFETVHRGILGSEFEITKKGEMVVVVEGAKSIALEFDGLTVKERLEMLINEGINKKDAVKIVAKERNIAKSEIYKISIDLGVI